MKAGLNKFVLADEYKQIFEETKAQYPDIWNWWKQLYVSGLSETGYKNYAPKFKLSIEEFKRVIGIFQKGGGQ